MGNPFLDMLFNPYGGGLGGANSVVRPRPSWNPRDQFSRDIFAENLQNLRQQKMQDEIAQSPGLGMEDMSEGAQAIIAAGQKANEALQQQRNAQATSGSPIGSPEYDADRQREMVLGANPNYRPTGMELTPAQRVIADTIMGAAAAGTQGRDEANAFVDNALANSPEGRAQAFAKAMQQKQMKQQKWDASDKAAKAETFDRWKKKLDDANVESFMASEARDRATGIPSEWKPGPSMGVLKGARPYQFPEISPERLAANQAKAADKAVERAQDMAQRKAYTTLKYQLGRAGFGPPVIGADPMMSMLASGGGEDFMRMMAMQQQAQLGYAGLANQSNIADLDRKAHLEGQRMVVGQRGQQDLDRAEDNIEKEYTDTVNNIRALTGTVYSPEVAAGLLAEAEKTRREKKAKLTGNSTVGDPVLHLAPNAGATTTPSDNPLTAPVSVESTLSPALRAIPLKSTPESIVASMLGIGNNPTIKISPKDIKTFVSARQLQEPLSAYRRKLQASRRQAALGSNVPELSKEHAMLNALLGADPEGDSIVTMDEAKRRVDDMFRNKVNSPMRPMPGKW